MTNPLINRFGTQIWYNIHNQLHRTDGPAILWTDGSQAWRADGKLHRTDGPAFISSDGSQSWWVNGHRKNNNKSFQEAANLTDEGMTALVLKYGNIK